MDPFNVNLTGVQEPRDGGRKGGRQQNWKLFNDVIIAEGKCVYTQWPATRPLVSVTGLAGFLFFLSPTEKPAGYELCGDRIVQKTGRVNDAHGIFLPSDGGRIRGGAPLLHLRSASPQLHPNHSAIASNYAFISKLCLGTALIFGGRERPRARTGRSPLLHPAALPRHLEQPHLKFIRRLRFLCRCGSGSATVVGLSEGVLLKVKRSLCEHH